jgi:putative endonuclease
MFLLFLFSLIMSVFVYVLESLKDGIHYVGMSENTEIRLKQHNQGKTKFTKGHIPWVLVHQEEYLNFMEARKREKYLKSAAGRRWIKKM